MATTVRRFAADEWSLYRELRLAHLFQVWVAPPHRGQGVGRSLTNAVIAWARARGLRSLRLGVTPSHPAALQLYRNAGFVNAGKPEPLRPGSSVPCQPMRLELNVSSLRSSTGG